MVLTGMEVIGALAAVLQLSEQLFKLGETCNRTIRRIRNANQEIQDFNSMFSIFGNSLFLFHVAVKEMEKGKCPIIQEQQTQRLVVEVSEMSKSKLRQIKDTVYRLRPLRDDNKSRTNLMKAKLMWALCDRQDMKELLASIEPVKSSISQLTVLFHLHICLTEVEMMRAKLKEVPPEMLTKLAILERKNKHLRRECKAANRRYEELYSKHEPVSSGRHSTTRRTSLFVSRVQDLAQTQVDATAVLLAELKQDSFTTLSSSATGNASQSEDTLPVRPGSSYVAMPFGDYNAAYSRRRSASVDLAPTCRCSACYSDNTESTVTKRTLMPAPLNTTARSMDHLGLRHLTIEASSEPASSHGLDEAEPAAHLEKPQTPQEDSLEQVEIVNAQNGVQNFFSIDSNGRFQFEKVILRSKQHENTGKAIEPDSSKTTPTHERLQETADHDDIIRPPSSSNDSVHSRTHSVSSWENW